MRQTQPDLPIVCVSTREPDETSRRLEPMAHLLKPFPLARLDEVLRTLA